MAQKPKKSTAPAKSKSTASKPSSSPAPRRRPDKLPVIVLGLFGLLIVGLFARSYYSQTITKKRLDDLTARVHKISFATVSPELNNSKTVTDFCTHSDVGPYQTGHMYCGTRTEVSRNTNADSAYLELAGAQVVIQKNFSDFALSRKNLVMKDSAGRSNGSELLNRNDYHCESSYDFVNSSTEELSFYCFTKTNKAYFPLED